MAFVLKDNGSIRAFGISQAVGKGKSNIPTDAMLVLYLIHRRILYTMDGPGGMGMYLLDPNKDYANQKIVTNMVTAFQSFEKNRGFPLKVDGLVNCPKSWSDSGKLYTIQHLNTAYQAAVITKFNNTIDPFELAFDDSQMHPVLKWQLMASAAFEGVI